MHLTYTHALFLSTSFLIKLYKIIIKIPPFFLRKTGFLIFLLYIMDKLQIKASSGVAVYNEVSLVLFGLNIDLNSLEI